MKMVKDKLKSVVATARKAKTMALVALPVEGSALLPMVSYAADAGANPVTDVFDSVSQGMLSSFQAMASAMGGFIGSIIPYALPIAGVVVLITLGMAVFRKVVRA